MTAGFCLTLLGACVTETTAPPKLPAETLFNQDAGHGSQLFLRLHLDDGKDLPFLLDTGSPVTILDRSLEAKLGKRIRLVSIQYGWLGNKTNAIYPAPKLYLGNVELMTDKQIWTDDLGLMSGSNSPLMGVLGMDCLRHYCIQLDFADRKLRFLDPQLLDGKSLGKRFWLKVSGGQFFLDENLLGVKHAKTMIDSAEYDDGALSATSFQRGLKNQKAWWRCAGKDREGCFPNGVLGGETYTNLVLKDCSLSADPAMNIIGLRFLARHLVTLNFPGRKMYLRRHDPEILGDWADNNPGYVLTVEAYKFLEGLKNAGELPGILKNDHGNASLTPPEENSETYPVSRTFTATKRGEIDLYHYVIIKTAGDGCWILQKAWRTDARGRVVKEYPVQQESIPTRR